jgi:hypothetical protein
MSDPARSPNAEERRAAEIVNRYVTEQENRKVTDEEFARMNARDRIEYCRRFTQNSLPPGATRANELSAPCPSSPLARSCFLIRSAGLVS